MPRPPSWVVTLYTSEGCGLCDAARDELLALAGPLGFSVRAVDVASDPALEREYRWGVPVVLVDGREIARAPIRPGTLRARLEAFS